MSYLSPKKSSTMQIKEFVGLQIFEFVYLVVLAILPFVLALRIVTVVVLTIAALWAVAVILKRLLVKNIHILDQTVLITGCDSGFGNALARRLEAVGFTVVAGCLNRESDGAARLQGIQSGRLSVIDLDVTQEDSVARCLDHVKQICRDKGLWALVNNAGVHSFGPIEFSTIDMYKRAADVNLYGLIRMTKAFLPLIKKAKGRVINVTGANALIGLPGESVNAVFKSAVEIFSETLQMELKGSKVSVVLIEPGNFLGATGVLSENGLTKIRHDYNEMWESASEELKAAVGREYLEVDYKNTVTKKSASSPNLAHVIDTMEIALIRQEPAFRYLVDGGNKIIDFINIIIRLKPFLPASWLQSLVHASVQPSVQQ